MIKMLFVVVEVLSGFSKKNNGLLCLLVMLQTSFGWEKCWVTEGSNQCFNKLAQNNWGGWFASHMGKFN